MNLEQAVEKKAREQADGILAKAKAEADARLERDTERLRQEHAHRIDVLRRELEADVDRQAGDAETRNRREVLRLKNEIISEIFDHALNGIASLPGDAYSNWLAEQMKSLPDHGRNMTLHSNPRDKEAIAKQAKATGTLATVGEADAGIRGGFIAQGKGRDLDFTTGSLMQSMRETLTERIVSTIFETGAKS